MTPLETVRLPNRNHTGNNNEDTSVRYPAPGTTILLLHLQFCKRILFYSDDVHADHLVWRVNIVGIFDDLGKALKQVEDGVKKSDLDKQLKSVEEGLNKAGKDLTMESGKVRNPARPSAPVPVSAGTQPARAPHPGYAKITAWMKRKYKARIPGIADPLQKDLELEQLSAEACSGLSAKTKKGFLDYLKSQHYEQLLK
jgi:hypothetical protein